MHGDRDAQYNLASFYEVEVGLQQDLEKLYIGISKQHFKNMI